MSKMFYPKLALNNLRKNKQTYLPYILISIGIILMFYNMVYLTVAKDIGSMSDSASLRSILFLGVIVIGVFSVIFLFYTNSFLIKRRKKEFGIFNILGMEKKHVAKIMFFETLFVALVCLVGGVLAGILFSKLMVLLLLKILTFEAVIGFEIPWRALLSTLLLFGAIFSVNLIYNVFQVHLARPIELLKGERVGEKEPKTKWVMTVIGVICLGIAYYIALTVESPLAALYLFLLAVLLVMVGTYCLFTAGSIAILKILRRNKVYYYKLKHFIPVSGMIYRMKQNAVGLANICILSTAVIVMISTTVSLYMGMTDVLRVRYPRNINVRAADRLFSDSEIDSLENLISEHIQQTQITPKDIISYSYNELLAIQNGSDFSPNLAYSYSESNNTELVFLTISEYNRMENKAVSLDEGEALLYTMRGKIPSDMVSFGDCKFSIVERLASLNTEGRMTAVLANIYYFIVDDQETINEVYLALGGKEVGLDKHYYYYGFDVDADEEAQINLVSTLQNTLKAHEVSAYAEGPAIAKDSFYTLYGGLFFLGLFLGLLFIMATVLIIYYKQVA